MIEALLQAPVVAVETTEDLVDVELFPEELASLRDPVEKRRREFVTGRACVRRALEELGAPTGPVPNGANGEPLWPEGVVGSITHCPGYRACAVARDQDVTSVGIDGERWKPLSSDVLDAIASPLERARLGPSGELDMVLFSAKEAVYKAWFPLTGRWLGFEDVDMVIDAAGGSFWARVLVPAPTVRGRPLTEFRGRWRRCDDLVLTSVVVPRGVSERP